MNIWDRFQSLDRRWYYALLVIVVSLPIIKPWGLPIKIGIETEKFLAAIDAVPAGEIVMLEVGYRTDSIVEMNPMMTTAFKQAFAKGLKIIAWACVDEGANLAMSVLTPVAESLGAVYGADWINLGFKPEGDATLQKMVDNFPEAVAYVDMAGNPLTQFPIMDGFTSIKQAKLILSIENVTPSPALRVLRMITIPHGTPLAVGVASVAVSEHMPFFSSGQYKGMLAGLRGAAEYEFLTGNPGPAIMGMDSQSAAHFLVILLIVLGNLGHFLNKKGSKGGEAA